MTIELTIERTAAGAARRKGSVRALAAIVVGHVLHHQGVVREPVPRAAVTSPLRRASVSS